MEAFFLRIQEFQDHSVDLDDQLKGIPEEMNMDIDLFIKTIHATHKVPRLYKFSKEAKAQFHAAKAKLNEMDAQSNYG